MVATIQATDELVRAAKAGDPAAFGALVDRYAAITHRYALLLLRDQGLAEDAVQEAFVDAFLHLWQLRRDTAFPAWLRRITLKHADRQRRQRLIATELVDLPSGVDPLAGLIEAEERRAIHGEVQGLPERLRASIALFYGADLSVAEIAAFLGVNPGTVKKRLFDGRNALRRSLDAPEPRQDGPRDAVTLLLATRTGDARGAASVLARRPDLATLRETWTDPSEVQDYGAIGAGFTLVQRACFMGHLEVVEVLLRASAPLQCAAGLEPLDLAVLQGNAAVVGLLLASGARPDAREDGLLGPLHRTAMRGNLEIALLLLAAGARVNAPGPGGRTAADWARLKGHAELAELMEDRPHA